ncbi:hypothetical protein [Bradyrhizobium sp. ORS 86]|uniref:hypothetical protein n=1 Tax=Bradyrhizobium sp. ORS 86 TaxID=1685970 RepID=UPI0038905E77
MRLPNEVPGAAVELPAVPIRPPVCSGAHRHAARQRDRLDVTALTEATVRNCGPILHVDPKLAPDHSIDPSFSQRAHAKAVKKRNGRLKVAIRRAVAINGGNRGAKEATQHLGRMLKKPHKATPSALKIAAEVLRRALRDHVDRTLVDRLEHAIARVELRQDAARLHLSPDTMAEVRMAAADVIGALFPTAT